MSLQMFKEMNDEEMMKVDAGMPPVLIFIGVCTAAYGAGYAAGKAYAHFTDDE